MRADLVLVTGGGGDRDAWKLMQHSSVPLLSSASSSGPQGLLTPRLRGIEEDMGAFVQVDREQGQYMEAEGSSPDSSGHSLESARA